MSEPRDPVPISALRADRKIEPMELTIFGLKGAAPTKIKSLADDNDARRAAIAAVRAGEQIELEFSAIVFRQQDGVPNANHLRFRSSKLGKIAKTFAGQPWLLDHNSWSTGSRVGTILDSTLEPDGKAAAFRMTVRAVKPAGVIGILDGTLDRFSIGWQRLGRDTVICSVHRGRVRQDCSCWPGDELAIDGAKQIVEYEFTDAQGIEVSAVNVPAVSGTRIDDIRAALAREINPRSNSMSTFLILATALGVSHVDGELDEGAAVKAVSGLKSSLAAAEAERDTFRERALASEALVAAARAAAGAAEAETLATRINTVIESAYQGGRLLRKLGADGKPVENKLEASLRKIAGTHGFEAFLAHVEELPAIVSLGQRSVLEATGQPDSTKPEGVLATALDSVAKQLGLDPAKLAAAAPTALNSKPRNYRGNGE